MDATQNDFYLDRTTMNGVNIKFTFLTIITNFKIFFFFTCSVSRKYKNKKIYKNNFNITAGY